MEHAGKNFLQEYLAEKANITTHNIENEKVCPIILVANISLALGMDLNRLLTLE